MLYDDELYMLKSNKIYVMLCYMFNIMLAYVYVLDGVSRPCDVHERERGQVEKHSRFVFVSSQLEFQISNLNLQVQVFSTKRQDENMLFKMSI